MAARTKTLWLRLNLNWSDVAPDCLTQNENEGRRPGILVQRRVQVPAAAAGFVIVGNAAAQWFLALVDAVESVELGLGDCDDRFTSQWPKMRRYGARRLAFSRRSIGIEIVHVRDLQVSIDVFTVEMCPVVMTLLQFAAFSKSAEAGVIDDRDEGGLPIGEQFPCS